MSDDGSPVHEQFSATTQGREVGINQSWSILTNWGVCFRVGVAECDTWYRKGKGRAIGNLTNPGMWEAPTTAVGTPSGTGEDIQGDFCSLMALLPNHQETPAADQGTVASAIALLLSPFQPGRNLIS